MAEEGELRQLLMRAEDVINNVLSLSVFDGEAYSDVVDDLIVLTEDINDVLWIPGEEYVLDEY